VPLPDLTASGDLPVGVHVATLREALDRFGSQSPRRRLVALRLQRIHELAVSTGHLARFVIFGSFVTDKPEPHDVDIFLLMDDSFDLSSVAGETQLLFEHETADVYFGASVFWLRRRSALGGEQAAIEDWQFKRDGTRRGIVELIVEGP
jgi:hypothetical protein